MELRHLRYFVAVAEANGIRGASRELHIAPAAISQTISDLEEELGTQLMERSGRSVRLTAVGKVFFAETKLTLRQADRAIRVAKDATLGFSGTLRIAFCGPGNYSYLAALVHSHCTLYQDVKIELLERNSQEIERGLANGSIDVGITRPLQTSSDSLLLYREPLFAVVPSSFQGPRFMLESLSTNSMILVEQQNAPYLFERVMALCRETGSKPQLARPQASLSLVYTMVAAGYGISVVPAGAYADRLPGLRFLPIEHVLTKADMILAWPARPQTAFVRTFVQLVENLLPEIQKRAEAAMPPSEEPL